MATKKITTLFLDIGGVLLTDGWGRVQRQNAIDKFGLDQSAVEDWNSLIWNTYESDKLTLDDYLNFAIFYEKRSFSKEEFIAFMMDQTKPIDGAIEYFKALKKERGYKVVALSNEARELNAYRIEEFKLNELFDFYISSCYVGLRKPAPEIYKLALDTAQAIPSESVYIDDRKMYTEMALRLGIPSLYYENLDSAKEFFKNV